MMYIHTAAQTNKKPKTWGIFWLEEDNAGIEWGIPGLGGGGSQAASHFMSYHLLPRAIFSLNFFPLFSSGVCFYLTRKGIMGGKASNGGSQEGRKEVRGSAGCAQSQSQY